MREMMIRVRFTGKNEIELDFVASFIKNMINRDVIVVINRRPSVMKGSS
jgi:hypothetical protein